MKTNKEKYKEILKEASTLEDVDKVLEYVNMFHSIIYIKDITHIEFYIINNIIIWKDTEINEELAFQIDITTFEKTFGFKIKMYHDEKELKRAFLKGCEFTEDAEYFTDKEKESEFIEWYFHNYIK